MDHLFFIVSWQALFKDEFLTNYLLKSFSVQCYAMLTIKFLFQIIYMKCIFNQIAAATMKSLHDVTVPQTTCQGNITEAASSKLSGKF